MKRAITHWTAFTCGVLLLGACGYRKESTLSQSCADSVEMVSHVTAFSTTVSPLFATYNCRSCHSGVSGLGPYSFASSDPTIGYADAYTLSNFTDPASSRFVTKVLEDHNCAPNCGVISNALKGQIASWAQQEAALPPISCGSSEEDLNRVVTGGLVVRLSELSATAKKYRFDLSQATPAIPNAGFEILATLNSAASSVSMGSYLLASPKLGLGGSQKMRVSNIQVWVNGVLDSGSTNYQGVDLVVTPGVFSLTATTWPFPVLSTATQMELVRQTSGDSLSFSFDLEPSDP